ncbi:DNA adenine methylase [Enterococcus avium]|uniref:DNA adenine methylase n=1 Tax=Enterococcus avium TaxID=33945 RepID=UPI00288DF290|nr:DNA adenine methylase [Enterococcus avium]MDT2563674.1 DNA adenine methylase [Enterococcus avium]
MVRAYSPLRYPGGKTKLYAYVKYLIQLNEIENCTYIEPFSGGAGLAMKLLVKGDVQRVVLNDLDNSIHSFWYAVLNDTKKFIKMIEDTPVTIDEWRNQKIIHEQQKDDPYSFYGGFATFYLNRTNFSGIINGSPIGGFDQSGKNKIDCRFTKQDLIARISLVANLETQIDLFHRDASELIDIIDERYDKRDSFVFFDPPYFSQGKNLYLKFIDEEKHQELFNKIMELNNYRWITTYDVHEQIADIYQEVKHKYKYRIQYSANKKSKASEFIFASPVTKIQDYGEITLEKIK